jgi:hypothetical protein
MEERKDVVEREWWKVGVCVSSKTSKPANRADDEGGRKKAKSVSTSSVSMRIRLLEA